MDRDEKTLELPPIDEVLVAVLSGIFPLKLPDLDMSDREIWYKIGQRSVIDYLLDHSRKQQEDSIGV